MLGIRSGTTVVTAKSKENNVFSSIEVQVYTPVTDLELNKEKLVLQIGDSYTVTPIVVPDDANNKNVIYSSDDGNIATVDDKGLIKAIKEGTTKIIVKTEEGDITKEINISVVPKLGEDEVSFDESLRVQQNEITGWDIKNNSVNKIKEMINTMYTVEIYNNKDELLSDDKLIGTGSKIRLIDENGTIKMEYEIIIYGDVNGDGKINALDLLVLQRHIIELQKLNGVYIKAGNINKNGKNPSAFDLLLIQRHILELKFIEQ